MYNHHSDNGTNTASTPKFKMNDTLVEIDGWRLVRPLYPNILGCESYMVHIECRGERRDERRDERRTLQNAGVRSVTPGGVRKGCVHCGKTPPDEIIALEMLHNGKI